MSSPPRIYSNNPFNPSTGSGRTEIDKAVRVLHQAQDARDITKAARVLRQAQDARDITKVPMKSG